MQIAGGHTQSSQSPTPPVFMGGVMSEVVCTSRCQVPSLPDLSVVPLTSSIPSLHMHPNEHFL